MVPAERIELPTFGLQNRCTTAVLRRPPIGLGQGLYSGLAGQWQQTLIEPLKTTLFFIGLLFANNAGKRFACSKKLIFLVNYKGEGLSGG